MQQALHRSSLVPRGFVVENAYFEGDKTLVAVRAFGSVGLCPSCGTVSRRVHTGIDDARPICRFPGCARRPTTRPSPIATWRV
jgi:hypothetical protein